MPEQQQCISHTVWDIRRDVGANCEEEADIRTEKCKESEYELIPIAKVRGCSERDRVHAWRNGCAVGEFLAYLLSCTLVNVHMKGSRIRGLVAGTGATCK
jgi:hypothetical protein